MPIKIADSLPARRVLEEENIFVIPATRAFHQDIRPLKLLILNLMPTKIATETQLLRCLSNTPLQIEVDLLQTSSYTSRNTPQEHLLTFYTTFDQVKDTRYDGMIITGAPVENMEFEEVAYWQELCEIFQWTKSHVFSTLHICWGAQAGLYYHYGVPKLPLEQKLFGVFPHRVLDRRCLLFRGFDDVFYAPHSRHTTVRLEDVERAGLQILSTSEEAGLYICSSGNGRQIYVTGHAEYDADTLKGEYFRDVDRGLPIQVPRHYFPDDDPTKEPLVSWRSHAHLLYTNWLNYFVYQTTPYDLKELKSAEPPGAAG